MNLKNRFLFNLTKKIILRNRKFKGLHSGESCYLFGNAKSLKYYDLSLFNDRVSIGCNFLFLHKDFGDIGMSYYYNADPFFFYPYWRNLYTGKIERHILGGLFEAKIRENSDVNFFINVFEWKNSSSNYKIRGEKYGSNFKINNLLIEGGYLNDNKSNDGGYGSIKLVIPLGATEDTAQDQKPFEYVSVRDKLYQPVKRENKIKVVKISTGVTVSGY